MSNKIKTETEQAASSAVETVVMFLTKHIKKVLFAVVFLIVVLIFFSSSMKSDEVYAFLSTPIIDMEIGHLVVLMVLWMMFKD